MIFANDIYSTGDDVVVNNTLRVGKDGAVERLVDAAWVPIGGAGVPYTSYVARVVFNGSGVTVTEIHNDVGDIVWVEEGLQYRAPLPAGISKSRCFLNVTAPAVSGGDEHMYLLAEVTVIGGTTHIRMTFFAADLEHVDPAGGETYVELRVYPPTA